MKIECVKDKVRNVIGFAEKITGKNATLPVLQSILITSDKNNIIIRSTNLEIGVEFTIPAKVIEGGSVAVPGSVVNNIFSNLHNDKNIVIESKNENLTITTDHNSLVVKSYPADDFPTIPTVKEGDEFEIESRKLIKGIQSVIYSASLSDIKPEIASVYIYPEDKNIVFVATDSIRLAEKKIDTKKQYEFEGIILPLKTAQEVIRVFNDYEGDILVKFNTNQISFINHETHLTSRVVNGNFPDYRQIIPKTSTTEVTILKDDLVNALKITNIFSDKFNRVDVVIDPKTKVCEFRSQNSDVGENITKIDSVLEGNAVDISFNQKYIIDCFNSIPQDSVTLQFNGSNKPLLVKGVGDTTFLYLIMPINR